MNRKNFALWLVCAASGLCVTVAAPVAFAEGDKAPEAAAQSLPSAKEIMDKYIAATGGVENYSKIKNRVSKGELDMPGAGIKATMESYTAEPNKMATKMVIPNMMTMENVTDGARAWIVSDTMGSRLLEGPELENTLREATFNSELQWEKLYKSVKVVGTDEVEGKPAYKVEVETHAGPKMTQWYEQESGLRVKLSMVAPTQMGDIETITKFSDYREVDGIKVPFKTTMSQMGQEGTLTLTEVRHNIDLPANMFDMPEEIKKLSAQQQPEAAPATPAAPETPKQ
jgi:zinc protease